jgi:nucleotide-binding universal stress UspA family protein
MERRTKQKAFSGYPRVLWPTDLSRLAKMALPHALRSVEGSKGELVILHVLPTVTAYMFPEIAGTAWDQIDRANRSIGKKKLDRIADEIRAEHPGIRVQIVLAEGVVFDEVLRVARRLRCDLIVLATHGRTGLKHVLMGSVAENVVRRAPCPVLIVRPRGYGSRITS